MIAERAALVDALGTVPGLAPSPGTPPSIVAGCAWPVLSVREWLNPCVYEATFYVFIALKAGTEQSAIEDADALCVAVGEALWKVGKVVRDEPWMWPVEPGGQAVPVQRYTVEV